MAFRTSRKSNNDIREVRIRHLPNVLASTWIGSGHWNMTVAACCNVTSCNTRCQLYVRDRKSTRMQEYAGIMLPLVFHMIACYCLTLQRCVQMISQCLPPFCIRSAGVLLMVYQPWSLNERGGEHWEIICTHVCQVNKMRKVAGLT